MYTHDVSDRFSGISAPDLAHRLVEMSSRGTAQQTTSSSTPSHLTLPPRVSALLWDAKSAGAAPPRTALLRGDTVQVIPRVPDATLSSVALSDNVRYRFALSRLRRLTGVLSSRAPFSLRMSTVNAIHFYWMDECAPAAEYDDMAVLSRVLQKKVAQWAVHAFTLNPLLRNISLQTLESTFPGLLFFPPCEREELLSQAAELLGQGTFIWYGGAIIKQFQDSSALPTLSLLTTNEERGCAALLFALATARDIMGDRRDDAAKALRYLVEVHGTRRVAKSPALTTAVLLVSRAMEPFYTCTCVGGRPPQRDLYQPYLFALSRADADALEEILPATESSSPQKYRHRVERFRDIAGTVLTTVVPPVPSTAARRQIHDEDVHAFFLANSIVEINRDTLVAHCVSGAPALTPTLEENDSSTAARLCLLEVAPRWWDNEEKAKNRQMTRGETELKLNIKAAAAALRDFHADEHAMLDVIHRKRNFKRQRRPIRYTSQAVESALETASIHVRRRSVLRLVDLMAHDSDDRDTGDKAREYLEELEVPKANIDHFSTLLSSMRET